MTRPSVPTTSARVLRSLVLGLALAAPSAAWAATPAEFAAHAPLQLSGDGPFHRLELPMSVRLAAHTADLRDLRIFNADGEALPHTIRDIPGSAAPVWSDPLPGAADGPDYLWTLPLALPLVQVRVAVDQPDTLAPVTLLGRADTSSTWTLLARGVLHRLVVDGREQVQEELDLPGRPTRGLKLQIDDRGVGLGAAPPSLTVAVPAVEVVFLARGRGPHTLAVGADGMAPASLPLTTLIPGHAPAQPPKFGVATLDGALQVHVPPPPPPAAPEPFAWKQALLWSVLGLAVLLLAAMAISLLRSLRKS